MKDYFLSNIVLLGCDPLRDENLSCSDLIDNLERV